ncbi:MAG: nucleoside-diphosphate sugar epimerase/dehydratase [Verrucomicrobiota bacterium]
MACFVSLYLSYQIRFEFEVPFEPKNWQLIMWETMQWIIPIELVVFYAFGLFEPLVARYRWRDLLRVGSGISLISGFLLYLWYIFEGEKTPPRSVIIINGLFLVVLMSAISSLSSQLRFILTGNLKALPTRPSRVVAVGTGFLCYQLIQQTRARSGLALRVVGLAVTESKLQAGDHWLGVPVGGHVSRIEKIFRRFDPDRVIVTDPMLSKEELRELVHSCRNLHVPVYIVPTAQEMFYGVLRLDTIRPVGLDDILGRHLLETDLPRIGRLLSGRRVMVTGAGGSIGSELCRQILAYAPSQLSILDFSEASLFQIEQNLRTMPMGDRVNPVLADVRDKETMAGILTSEQPEIIFHSAALKHVPMVEAFPAEALRTNSLATNQLADLAAQSGVERMIFVSTDKAINPTSLMGASKRLAELFIQAHSRNGPDTAFLAVRFGNVIGSSGSVVPTFERQIAAGGPVTVTHEDVQRYFMSIPEAVGLVLQSATQGSGGEIFMLDMGQPLKVLDIAREMIQLRGLEPKRDIEIRIVGLRPGEKLFEELRYDEEIHDTTSHPRVYRLTAEALSRDEAKQLLARVEEASHLSNPDEIQQVIKELIPEFIDKDEAIRVNQSSPSPVGRI